MNITLNNYEEYFLLLADNELSPAEEALVKQFAARHPHLQEELQVLCDCRLDATDMPVFPKEMLLRPTLWNIENPAPVHTQMLSLLDNELPVTEKEQLQQQIAKSPVLQAEWNTLQKTVLPAEVIAYPNKTDLYRQHKIRPLAWMRWAAAAAVVALAWFIWPLKINNSQLYGTVGKVILPTVSTPKNVVPAQSNPTSINDTNISEQKNEHTSIAAVAVTQQRSTDITKAQNKTGETTASARLIHTAKKKDNKALLKEEMVVSEPEELAVIEPKIATLGTSNSVVATLSEDEDRIVQTAPFAAENSMLSAAALQSTMARHIINETNEEESYVHIAGARFDKQKVRGLFRGITRSVTRTFSKSKIQPAEAAYANRNL